MKVALFVLLIALCLALVSGGRELKIAYCVCTSSGYGVHDLDNCPDKGIECFGTPVVAAPAPGR